jgi:type II secretion system protein H
MPIESLAHPLLAPMRRGFSLVELAVTLAIAAFVTTITLPRIGHLLDRIAVERAASELTTALAVARHRAILRSTRARLSIADDSLRIDEWDSRDWTPAVRWPGPGSHGVEVDTSNPTVVFDPLGLGWGVANTRVVLSRGSQFVTVTTSRAGRVKRW